MKRIIVLGSVMACMVTSFCNAQTGTISTFAGGTSWAGYAGDGLAANNPSVIFMRTTGVCGDAAGNIYIVDWGNSRIRKVDAATNILSTIAGNGIHGYTGDGGPATSATIDNYCLGACADNMGNVYYVE